MKIVVDVRRFMPSIQQFVKDSVLDVVGNSIGRIVEDPRRIYISIPRRCIRLRNTISRSKILSKRETHVY